VPDSELMSMEKVARHDLICNVVMGWRFSKDRMAQLEKSQLGILLGEHIKLN